MKPISEACLRNQAPIAEALAPYFMPIQTVFEIGSGTGQHAVFLAEKMPHLEWHPSDLANCLRGIDAWIEEAGLRNVKAPIELDVTSDHWPKNMHVDAVFTANTIHFIGWNAVEVLLGGVISMLRPQGLFCVYGPFNKEGKYTSIGNQQLDVWLKNRDAESGIKDIDVLCSRAKNYGLLLLDSHLLPANNWLLIFRYSKHTIK